MELIQLRFFLAVERCRSLLRASEQLNISQPALSQRIHQLEAELGVELFQRHSRGVTLTEAGAILKGEATKILSAASAGRAAIDHWKGNPDRSLSIGAPASICRILIPSLLTHNDGEQKMKIEVRQGYPDDLYGRVLSGKLDAAILDDHRDVKLPHAQMLAEQDIVVMGSPDYLDSLAGSISLREALRMPLVVDIVGNPDRTLVEDMARNSGHSLNIVAEIEPLSSRREFLWSRNCCCIAPVGAFLTEVKQKRLTYRKIADPHVRLAVYLVCRQDLDQGKAANLVKMTKSAIESMEEDIDCGIRAI